MAKKVNSGLQTATVLAFERKIDPSDALMFAGNWDQRDGTLDACDEKDWMPIRLREKSVRGTISNRIKGKDQDPLKLNAEIQKPNLQTIDVATLPADCDTLKVSFTVRVLGGVGVPSACNNAEYKRKLLDTVDSYIKNQGLGELASRYAWNIANARFLWRNRMASEDVEVHVQHLVHGEAQSTWVFNALDFSLRDFQSAVSNAGVQGLAGVIRNGLSGTQPALLNITVFARMGAGQEVYPSQELIMEKTAKDKKSKWLYEVGGVAAMHSQKIGNALRTIDTWHPEFDEIGPISVEPYGSVTNLGTAFRKPTDKMDFYTQFDNWVINDSAPALEQQHFVIATLIRGGVFGDAGKE